MAQERKASEGASPGARALRSPVPPAKKDDVEDVAWALQTAEATWSRGDHGDALKWIRRAAEAASEAERDDRALELAKAAADVASLLADRPTAVAPGPPPLPASVAAPTSKSSKPPPPAAPASVRAGVAAPTPVKVGSFVPALPRPGQKGPTPPRVQTTPLSTKRGGRRSSPSLSDEAQLADHARPRRASTTNETKRRSRHSRPPDETVQVASVGARHHPATEEAEAWPTANLVGDEDDAQHTRIGTPAYRESAEKASARPPAMLASASLVQSQAVRVVVWRSADGVHIAPAGSQVTAIGVEALLVALDPHADLAAWLSNK